MRALVFLAEVAIVLAVAYLVYRGVTALPRGQQPRGPEVAAGVRMPRLPMGGRWQARHYADDGHTVVAVARMTQAGDVIEEHVVARIPDSDADWSRKFLQAKEEAEERAFHLNADSPP